MSAAFREYVPLAPYTTIRLGGPARYLVECASVNETREALEFAGRRSLPVQVLGGGSNVVFPDAGFPGLVLRVGLLGREFREGGRQVEVTAGAGEDWDTLVQECVTRGLGGLECLSGIPGTVGGTPIQNVGAYGQEVRDTIVSVSCLDRDRLESPPVTFAAAECGFQYRWSRFKGPDRDRWVVLGVTYRLPKDARPAPWYPELVEAVRGQGEPSLDLIRRAVLDLRRRKAMVLDPDDPDTRSVGSFFTNPVLSRGAYDTLVRVWARTAPPPGFPTDGGVKVPAAWLIEHAGFAKGLRRGGVGISRKHALALVNYGGSSEELLRLAEEIQAAVHQRFGVRLVPEPVIVKEP